MRKILFWIKLCNQFFFYSNIVERFWKCWRGTNRTDASDTKVVTVNKTKFCKPVRHQRSVKMPLWSSLQIVSSEHVFRNKLLAANNKECYFPLRSASEMKGEWDYKTIAVSKRRSREQPFPNETFICKQIISSDPPIPPEVCKQTNTLTKHHLNQYSRQKWPQIFSSEILSHQNYKPKSNSQKLRKFAFERTKTAQIYVICNFY